MFAVPGAFDDSRFSGNHKLLQEGAKLVTGVNDILDELHYIMPSRVISSHEIAENDGLRPLRDLFHSLGGSATLDELVTASEASLERLLELLELGQELGVVREVASQHYMWLSHFGAIA